MEVCRPHEAVKSRRVMFCVIVVHIGYAWFPVDKELAAAGALVDPAEAHVDGFGALLFDGVICKSNIGWFVYLHGRVHLGVAKFAEQCADGDGFLFIDIGGADFGFGGWSHDVIHDFRHGVNGSIEPRLPFGRLFRIMQAVAEKIMATGTALCAGPGKVRGVAVDV